MNSNLKELTEGISHFFRANSDPKDEKIKRLEAENNNIKRMLEKTIFYARRYVDGRRTYSPTDVNEIIDEAMKLGVKIEPDGAFVPARIYAEDGDLGKWDSKRQRFEKE